MAWRTVYAKAEMRVGMSAVVKATIMAAMTAVVRVEWMAIEMVDLMAEL